MRYGALLLALSACVACILTRVPGTHAQQPFQLHAEWRELEYEFPTEAERQRTLQTQEYVPGNGVSIDMDVDYGSPGGRRVFVTVPRFVGGNPITLGTLTGQRGVNGNPLIRAYPNYALNANQGTNCNGLTSVFRVVVDECRRLWVLDAGKVGDTQNCPPQLVVFDLDSDTIIRQYKFPESQYKIGSSLFITPAVDVRDPTPATPGQCPNTMVYIADVNGFGLIVYDFLNDLSWRVQNKFFYPTPQSGTFSLAGESFDLMDGVFGLSVSPMQSGSRRRRRAIGMHSHQQRFPSLYKFSFPNFRLDNLQPTKPALRDRMLYFHALASTSEIAVPLRIVDNSSMWLANVESVPRAFTEIGKRGAQATAQAMDSNGNLFFGLVTPIGIGCWDSEQRTYGRDSIRVVAQNDETLQFSSGLKIRRNPNGGEELWVLSCRFQKVMTNTLSTDEVNFRIQSIDLNTLLGGKSRCSASRSVDVNNAAVLFPVT